jgi:tRNA dimethylallyltransferase
MTAAQPPAEPLVAILGPTAAGKSALAIALARTRPAEILCCDSTQLYRGFDIGTGKLTPEQQAGIRHHLMDMLEPDAVFTAGDYRRLALAALEDLRARGRLPIFTVGTGLYFRALLEGLAEAPTRSEELRARLRRRAELHGSPYLHRVLRRLDPEAAARIAPQDTPKLIRAIEVTVLAGRPITEVHRSGRPRLEGWHAIKIGLLPPRRLLYTRIEQRVEAMLAAGWLDEVRRLLDAGIPPSAKPFKFIGYGQLRSSLTGVVPLEEATRIIKQATRRYAKRQITWFRKEPGVHWIEGPGDDPAVQALALEYLNEQLAAGSRPEAAESV